MIRPRLGAVHAGQEADRHLEAQSRRGPPAVAHRRPLLLPHASSCPSRDAPAASPRASPVRFAPGHGRSLAVRATSGTAHGCWNRGRHRACSCSSVPARRRWHRGCPAVVQGSFAAATWKGGARTSLVAAPTLPSARYGPVSRPVRLQAPRRSRCIHPVAHPVVPRRPRRDGRRGVIAGGSCPFDVLIAPERHTPMRSRHSYPGTATILLPVGSSLDQERGSGRHAIHSTRAVAGTRSTPRGPVSTAARNS